MNGMLRRCGQVVAKRIRPTQLIASRHLPALSEDSIVIAEKWDLYAGVLLERLPVVSKTLNQLERQFQDMLGQVELESSLKSDYELQHERELLQAELIKSKMEVDLDESSSKQTVQDLKDAYADEWKTFTLAPRTTVDDVANNTTSTNRCFEQTLYLLLQQEFGKRQHLLLPQGPRFEGETMRQAAERVLREKCGEHLKVSFEGNAPCGFYKYKFPSANRDQSVGAKVFFYRATLQHGNVDQKIGPKFEWLKKAELGDKFNNAAYTKIIQKLLL